MKGMMSFLERTGFVRSKEEVEGVPLEVEGAATDATIAPPVEPALPVEQAIGLSLDQIYATAGVPASTYPAERLMRLLDGLSMMDEAVRRQAIQAMDAADDSWTIEDPIRDAIGKIPVLNDHAVAVRVGVEQAERETHAMVAQVKEREAATVADIRRQISDLEGLLAREVARSAQESAELQAALQVKHDGADRAIEQLNQASAQLKRLITQFGSAKPAPAGSAA